MMMFNRRGFLKFLSLFSINAFGLHVNRKSAQASSAFEFKTGQFNLAASGSQTVDTGTGVDGKVLFLWTERQAVEGAAATILGASFGIALSATKRGAIGWAATDNLATTDVASAFYNNSILIGPDPGGVDMRVDFTSFGTGGDAGKFTISVVTNVGSIASKVYYLILCGTDFTADLIQYAANTSATSRDDDTPATSLGGDNIPDFAFMFGKAGTNVNIVDAFISTWIGCARASGKQWSIADGARDAQTGTGHCKHQQSTGKCLTQLNFNGTAIDALANHTAFIAGGQTLNWTDAAGEGSPYMTLYLKGGVWDAGNFAAPTGGGTPQTQSITTAAALSGAMFISAGQATATDTLGAGHGTMIGAGANPGTAQESVTMIKGQDAINSDENRYNVSTECIAILNPTLVAAADYVSQDADSFDISWDTIDASNAYKIFWFGGGPAPVSANRRRLTVFGVGS